MAILGTQQDFAQRLAGLLPPGWYPNAAVGDGTNPVLDSTLSATGEALSRLWTLLTYVGEQTRIATATESNLDIIARDYLGTGFNRRANETDAAFRARIQQAILTPRVTRAALSQAIEALTGTTPTIIVPSSADDCGAWDSPATAWDSPVAFWGSLSMPQDIFLIVTLPPGGGVPYAEGWDSGSSGWDTGESSWVDDSMVVALVTEQDVYDTVNRTRPANLRVWVQFGPQPQG